MAILNSRIAQFLYKREFNSIKVLRSHIEAIPIPVVNDTMQNRIIEITDKLIAGLEPKEAETTYDVLDTLISELFKLTPSEIAIIKKVVDDENKDLYIFDEYYKNKMTDDKTAIEIASYKDKLITTTQMPSKRNSYDRKKRKTEV